MKSTAYKLIELFLLFVLFPIALALPYAIGLKMGLGILGFVYILWVMARVENIRFQIPKQLPWRTFWKRTLIIFLIIALLTILFVWWQAPQHLFYVPFQHPLLFFFILFFYSILSVWPQEILYRTFFFKRYGVFFNSTYLLVFVNATLFSLAHLFFRNTLVIVLTFLGGILFGLTFLKYKSTTLVTIEHAIYGNWLFTVGMGQMLGFPGMETS